jgi:UDP-N-acetylmuramate dehydrogenase
MKFYNNVSLKAYNTFGLDAHARLFTVVNSSEAMQVVLAAHKEPLFVLGGGSNMLLTRDIEELVVKNGIKGKRIVAEDKNSAIVALGGGENWHDCVLWSLEQQLGGIENLSLIPGTAGAAPIQNIGAYGVELEQVFEKLEAIDLKSGKIEVFDHPACAFGYRQSIFKKELKGQFFITQIFLRLSKQPQLNLSYGAIQQTLDKWAIEQASIADVSKAVIAIRQSKLPDPAQLGNSGSFFKNPVISQEHFDLLQQQFPNIVFYPVGQEKVKVPAGWLIEQCGWKGRRVGNTGCYEKQALVLVNYGGATGQEIFELAQAIIQSVESKFGIRLEPEVNVV